MSDTNVFLIYQDDNGVSNVNVRFEGEDVWLAAEQIKSCFRQVVRMSPTISTRSTVTVNLCARQLAKSFCKFDKRVRGASNASLRTTTLT